MIFSVPASFFTYVIIIQVILLIIQIILGFVAVRQVKKGNTDISHFLESLSYFCFGSIMTLVVVFFVLQHFMVISS